MNVPSAARRASSRSIRITRRTLLIAACLAVLPTSSVLVDAAGTVVVTASTATPSFPQSIVFHLEGTAQGSEIASVSLLYHAANTPYFKRVHVPSERGTNAKIDFTLDMQTNFLPPGVDIEYRWLFILADGTQVRTSTATIFYMDGRQPWKKLQNGQITLWYYSGDDAFGKDVVDTAARAADTLKKTFNVQGDRPIRILVYANTRDMHDALPPNSAEWIGGAARTDLGLIIAAISPGRSASAEVRRIIPHEISHQIVHQASDNPFGDPPLWLDEGLAVRNQETPDVRFRPLLRDALDNGKMIPIRALDSPFPLDATQALLSYAESESLVNYIINAYKPQTIGALVAAFKDGTTVEQAVQQVMKTNLDDLDHDWKASLAYGGDQGGITG